MADIRKAGLVVVGSGLAGYTLAREFRKLDKTTPVTIVTADGGEVYSKPMLSNAFAQNKTAADLVQKTADQARAELDIAVLVRSRVEAIDRPGRTLMVRSAADALFRLGYDKLALALGADPRPYAVPGSDGAPLLSVNDLDGYDRWRRALADGKRVLLIGAGLIGCEFANDLAGAGFAVTLVDPSPWPLGRLLPEPVGRLMAGSLRNAGLTLHLGRAVARMEQVARGWRAMLDDGTAVDFDLALSAIGLAPRTALAEAAGLAVDRGIAVDGWLRSSDPDIHALGDCAATSAGPLPFVLPLMAQARSLAKTLTGQATTLQLPALPVMVKTPCLPMALCSPPPGSAGRWETEGDGADLIARFVAEDGRLLGFVVTGAKVGQRQALAKGLPDLISS